MHPIQNKYIRPAYLITVPLVVSAGSEEETSEGEEGKDFTKEEYKYPPFEIDWTKTGEIKSNDEVFF
jgi:hypothetical protein